MKVKKYIALFTILIFTFMQLQGCTSAHKETTTYTTTQYFHSSAVSAEKKTDKSASDSIVNAKTASITAGVVAVGLLVVVGAAILIAGAAGAGGVMGGAVPIG